MTIGDVNSDERGTGARFNGGKARFDVVPLIGLESAAQVLE